MKPTLPNLSAPTRRALLQQWAALGLGGPLGSAAGGLGLSLAAMGQASAATGGDYRALVCVFLYGGNDAYNTVLATDSASWAAYSQARSANSHAIALAAPGTPAVSSSSATQSATLHARLGGALAIQPARAQGRSFALHPAMGEAASLFGQGRLAVLPNVGPLAAPTSKTAYLAGSVAKPPKLFSHNDQQSVWQAFAAEGATQGWGGRMADLLLAGNQQAMFTNISISGSPVWSAGAQSRSYQLATSGAVAIGAPGGALLGSALVQQKLLGLMGQARNNQLLEREQAAMVVRSVAAEGLLRGSLPGASAGPWGSAGLGSGQIDPLLLLKTPGTNETALNPLAAQLQAVARMIAARQTLGMTRQVFFVALPGFDTHDTQAERHALALAQLSHGLGYFDSTLRQMGVDKSVTTFTASDFGRNFSSNGDGCDHGWGGHHLVMGGAVRGGDLYGNFPIYGIADGKGGYTSPDQLSQGALLPATPVEAYAATLGRWMGLGNSQLLEILPALGRFDSSAQNLGFMG